MQSVQHRPIDLDVDPAQYGNGLVVFGELSIHGAVKSPTFVRLAEEPKAGQSNLSLEAETNWATGDRLILPNSQQRRASENRPAGTEELTIGPIASTSLTLSEALLYDHDGAVDFQGNLDFLPHVGNLTQNVLIRSENPSGTRGHTLFAHRANIDVRYARFLELGRTRNGEELHSTVFDAEGNPTQIGTNQVARYPIHTHHLKGPASPQEYGYQFTLIGNAIDGGTADHAFRWGLAIHASHYGLVLDNVVYNAVGAGIVTEDGTEVHNVFDHNFVVRTPGEGTGYKHASGGDAFWFHGTQNHVRNNVAADATEDGYTIFMQISGSNIVPDRKSVV